MCIYSCVQTYNSQNNSILPFLKPNIFMPNVLQPKTQLLCLHFVFLFLGTKFLEHFKPKVGASGSFVSGGTRKILQRQRALSCWSEQSRQRCWGWKSGVPGASFTGIREQFIHSRLWIYWFGHSFCQGDCKDGHTPHTHRLPSVKPEFILCQNIPRAGNPSLPVRFQINSKAPWDLSIALYQRPPADKACHKTATDRCHCSLAPRKSCCCKAGDAPPFFPFPGLTGHRLPPVSVPWAV